MKCPKCSSDFEQLQTPLGDVERCPACKGRFYDAGEFKDLATLDLSDFFKKFGLVERL
ncbi:zf-TFIIB domain-containing protein [Vibrio vulnificus]